MSRKDRLDARRLAAKHVIPLGDRIKDWFYRTFLVLAIIVIFILALRLR